MNAMVLPNQYFLQTTHILEALATATSIQERRKTLELALVVFDHDDTKAHDGAASAIVLLTRCLQKHFFYSATADSHGATSASYVRLICMLFGCSDQTAVKAFHLIGAELIALLLSLFNEYQLEVDVALSITDLIDRMAQLNISLPITEKKDLLVRLVQRIIRGEYECRQLQSMALQLISCWTKHPDSKRYIMNLPALVEDIIAISLLQHTVGLMASQDDCCTIRLHVAHCFRRLAWDGVSKYELVHKKCFLKLILVLLSDNDKRSSRSSETVRAAIDILRQLATEAVCRVTICKHDKYAILQALLNKMDDPKYSDAVNHTLLRLIGKDTASYLLKNTDLIDRLIFSAQKDKDCLCGNEASVFAAQALKRFASYVSVRNKNHPNLLDALTLLASAKNSRIRFWAAKGLCEQSKSSTGRFYITRTDEVLRTLVDLAKADPCTSVKFTATETLLTLALDISNAKRLVSSSDVLETLAETAKQANECETSARSAIQAILTLATHMTTNKQRVAKTRGLVESLSSYGVSQDTDKELKRAALHCVIVLAPLM